jgi:hypothetical protein
LRQPPTLDEILAPAALRQEIGHHKALWHLHVAHVDQQEIRALWLGVRQAELVKVRAQHVSALAVRVQLGAKEIARLALL